MLRNSNGFVLAMFSNRVGFMVSNEVEVAAIFEALWMFVLSSFQANLIVECDSLNPTSWMSSSAKFMWRFHFFLFFK